MKLYMTQDIKKEPTPRRQKRPSSPASDTPSVKKKPLVNRGSLGRPRRSASVDEDRKPEVEDKNIFTQIVGKVVSLIN